MYERFSNDAVAVGVINLADLAAVGRLRGHDGLSYPFAYTRPQKQHRQRIASVADRLDDGDLSAFRAWIDAYIDANIWVACRVHHRNPGNRGGRMLAYSAGQAGYVASQRENDDVVEVSELSALDLGAVIAGSVGLAKSGSQPQVVIPGYIGYFAPHAAADYDDSGNDAFYSVAVADRLPQAHPVVDDEDVTAVAIIQSRWQPPRRWGVDWTKNVVVCVQTESDGDYIYAPDFGHAVPVNEQILSERIDELIAEDIETAARPSGNRISLP